MFKKILKLITNPRNEYKKIIPFIVGKTFYTRKKICEFFGIGKYSITYPGHFELLKHFGHIRNGFFIECGGNNGVSQDPTYYLEKLMDWNGIIVEPLPVYKKCEENRKKSRVFNYALVADDFDKKTITLINCDFMTVVKGQDGYEDWVKKGEKVQNIKSEEIEVPTITLNKILDEYSKKTPLVKIDLLVIDTEGYELNVLKGLDLNKYKPEYLLIEISTQERKDMIESFINGKYLYVSNVGDVDILYKRI